MSSVKKSKVKELNTLLAEASNKQLISYLLSFSNTAINAENMGINIGGETGLDIGMTILEYVKRTDKKTAKMFKEAEKKQNDS